MSYSQEIYDAVRSKIGVCDVGAAVREAAQGAFDIGEVKAEFLNAIREAQRPSVLMRPELSQEGNAWLAIYGDLPTGVVGTGRSPAEAMFDFDMAWYRHAGGSAP